MPTLDQFAAPASYKPRTDPRTVDRDRPGLIRGLVLAAGSEWKSAFAYRQFDRMGYEPDPDFALTPDFVKALGDGIPEEAWERFEDAVSEQHAMKIREELLGLSQDRADLAKMGWTGTALRLGAAVFDPVDIGIAVGAGLLSGGAGTAAGVATKANRLRRMAAAGFLAESVGQAYLSSQDYEQDEWDVLFAGVSGATFGALPELWRGTRMAVGAKKISHDLNIRAAMGAAARGEFTSAGEILRGTSLAPKGKVAFSSHIDGTRQREWIAHLSRDLDPVADADLIARLNSMDPDEALNELIKGRGPSQTGALADETIETTTPEGTTAVQRVIKAGDFDERDATEDPARWSLLRGIGPFKSFAARLGTNDSPLVRRLASKIVEDVLPKRGGTPSPAAATTAVHREYTKRMSRHYKEYDAAWSAFRKEQGVTLRDYNAAKRNFNRQVGIELDRNPIERDGFIDANIKRARDSARAVINDTVEFAKRHQLPGFERIEAGDSYFPRIYDKSGIVKAERLFGVDRTKELFAAAVEPFQYTRAGKLVEADAEIRRKIGEGMLQTIKDSRILTDADKVALLSGERGDLLGQILKDYDVDPDAIEGIVSSAIPAGDDAGKVSRAKHRVRLNMDAFVDTPQGVLSMRDLIDFDVNRVLHGYVRQLVGASISHRLYQIVSKGPDDVVQSFDTVQRRLRRDMDAVGYSPKEADATVDLFEQLDRHIRGLPMKKDATGWAILDRLRKIAAINMNGQFGIAALPEFAQPVLEVGFIASLQQMSALKAVVRSARTGQLSNDLLDSLESFAGVGVESLVQRFDDRLDDVVGLAERFDGAVDQGLYAVQKASYKASGATLITAMQQRWTAATIAQKFVNQAKRGGMFNAGRLRTMNLSEENAARILKAMKAEIDAERGIKTIRGPLLGRKVADIDIDAWKDQEAAALFVDALDRYTHTLIQRPDLGQMAPWMTTDLGRMVMQFRIFPWAAWEKQFLRRAAARDGHAVSATLGGLAMAGLVYVAKTHLDAIGREDKDAFLAEKLTDQAIARAAVQRAGFSALIPGLIDTAGDFTGTGTVFSNRASGLENVLISLDQNPSIALLRGVYEAGSSAVKYATGADRTITEAEARRASRLLPFSRTIGVKNFVDSVLTKLPSEQ